MGDEVISKALPQQGETQALGSLPELAVAVAIQPVPVAIHGPDQPVPPPPPGSHPADQRASQADCGSIQPAVVGLDPLRVGPPRDAGSQGRTRH
jgi:hypothetical protein